MLSPMFYFSTHVSVIERERERERKKERKKEREIISRYYLCTMIIADGCYGMYV